MTQREDKMEANINFVAQEVGTEWKWLGRELQIANCVINNIEDENRSNKERAYQVMIRWYHSNGRAVATREALIRALRAINLTSIADEFESYQEDPNMQSNLLRLIKDSEERTSIEEQCASPETESSSSRKSPVSETQSRKSPVSETQSRKSPVSETQSRKSPVSETQSRKSPVSETQSRTLPVSKSPSPTHTLNSFTKAFDQELDEILQKCQQSIPENPDPCSRSHNVSILRNIEAMNHILLNDETATEEARRRREIRSVHIKQTSRLILRLLTDPDMNNTAPEQANTRRMRSQSERLRRCTSLVTIERRSKTYSAGSRNLRKSSISSPISASQENLMSIDRSRNEGSRNGSSRECSPATACGVQETMCERANEVFREEEEEIAYCVNCDRCYFEEETPDSSEAQEASLDENDNEILEPDLIRN